MSRISIVLPIYNGERYVRESIDSIRNQTFQDWELIIVNDCSTDSTPDIINEYAKLDGRIRIINNITNQKLPKSLNIGFKNASGEYLTWTSDDNYYLPEALGGMLNILEKYPKAAMVCGNMDIIDSRGKVVGCEVPYDDSKLALYNGIGACFLYRRMVWEEVGEYDTSLFLVEDYDYWLRVRERYGVILHLDTVLYRYRRHEQSLSLSRRKEVLHSLMILRNKHSDFIIEQLRDTPQFLFQIFAENYVNGYVSSSINDRIVALVAEIAPIIEFVEKEKVIVFGAGHYGRKYCELTNKDVLCFVDNNINSIGKTIQNVEVCNLEQIEKYKNIASVVIAMSVDKQYEVVQQLWQAGYKNYTIWMTED